MILQLLEFNKELILDSRSVLEFELNLHEAANKIKHIFITS